MDRAERVSVLCAPYDSGVTFRHGASEGPTAVLDAVWKGLPGGRFGNQEGSSWRTGVKQVTSYTDWIPPRGFEDLTLGLRELVSEMAVDSFPVVLGGDHSVTAGAFLGACLGRHTESALLVFDAHLDCWRTDGAHNHSSFLRHLVENEGVPGHRISVLGVRGIVPQDLVEDVRSLGIGVVTASQLLQDGVANTLQEALGRQGDVPVYLSIDIDVLDPSHAPGTGTPEWCGLGPRELFDSIEVLAGCGRLVGFDLVEVAPRFDPTQRTQLLAAELLWRMLLLLNSEKGVDVETA